MWRAAKLGEQLARTFQEAAMKYLGQELELKDYDSKERRIAWFGTAFAGRALHTITVDEIMGALPELSGQQHWEGVERRKVSNGTHNRYFATIRIMLNDAALKWQWTNRAPSLEDLSEPGKRIRWITRDEAGTLFGSR